MLLNVKSNFLISGLVLIAIPLTLFACAGEKEKELTEREKQVIDSLSRFDQRRKADSLRKANPLLIVPPDSQYTGDYIDKYDNGIVKFKGFFRFGQRHGHWLSFYPNGEVWSEMHYDKGLREDQNITYYESGKKRYDGFYKNDLQDSVWTYYDTAGLVMEKVLYKNDRVIKRLPR